MKIVAENKKARFSYDIFEKFEAGIVLTGQEAKSLLTKGTNLAGSYVIVKNGDVFWIGGKISPYQPKNAPPDYIPERSRKLLLNKKEIKYLAGKSKVKGLTLIPLALYTKNAKNQDSQKRGKIKLEFAVAKGKKIFDKREKIKKQDIQREIERTFKEYR